MKQALILLVFSTSATWSIGQDYSAFVRKADSLDKVKDYRKAALAYSQAFKTMGWKGKQNDRYNAACSWALAGLHDSAFYQLDNIVTKTDFTDYQHLATDPDFYSLHNDKRWEATLERVRQNKNKAEANLNKPLTAELDSVFEEDQKYRVQIDSVAKKFGWNSKEVNLLWRVIKEKDSINLIKVKNVLDKYGWLGADVIGVKGNGTLFLVIQHADKATQEKYLPMMREAVKNGKARGSSLALLEDRVALRQRKKQIYGSQISQDTDTHTYYISPLEDPDNVDKRRAAVGLEPLAEYVKQWQIKWDVEQYKKDLSSIEAKEKFRLN